MISVLNYWILLCPTFYCLLVHSEVVCADNEANKEIVYRPPSPAELLEPLGDLEKFINSNKPNDLDPILNMAIIHHQFESIHPFYDGNGRIGRILNIIYLVRQGLLDNPILYISRYINHNKQNYYRLLQAVRDEGNWDEWLLFMIKAVGKTAQQTIGLINQIKELHQSYKNILRNQHPKIYSQDLLNNIFKHPCTKVSFLQDDLSISRVAASSYLNSLVEEGMLSKHKLGHENYI